MAPRLDPDGLAQLHERMAEHVANGEMPGLVTLVASGPEVSVDVVGSPSFDDPAPLSRDAIFRIASVGKPLLAAGALTLVEDGTLRLTDPIDDLIPELANRRVLRTIDAELDDTMPAARSITVEDLLTFRMGIGSVMAPPGSLPFQRAEADLGLQSIGGPPWPPVAHDVDSWIAALGTLPLLHQPGERFLYNTSAQVLGVLVARAAGRPLPEVLEARVFGPLGMVDTCFTVPADRLDRLTTFYAPDPETDELSVLDDPADSWWATPPGFPDGSGWMVSTIDDLWTFVSMLLSGGAHDGTRILTAGTVELMCQDHLTPAQREGAGIFLGEGAGWGLGMQAPAAGSAPLPLPYGIGWDGGSGTTWHTNVDRGTTGILLTQRALTSPKPPPAYEDFWTGVNATVGHPSS